MVFLQSLLLWSYCDISLKFGFTQAGISQPAFLRVLTVWGAWAPSWFLLASLATRGLEQRQQQPQPLGGGHRSDLGFSFQCCALCRAGAVGWEVVLESSRSWKMFHRVKYKVKYWLIDNSCRTSQGWATVGRILHFHSPVTQSLQTFGTNFSPLTSHAIARIIILAEMPGGITSGSNTQKSLILFSISSPQTDSQGNFSGVVLKANHGSSPTRTFPAPAVPRGTVCSTAGWKENWKYPNTALPQSGSVCSLCFRETS